MDLKSWQEADQWAPVIDDPLAWQDTIDASGQHPNMRGSARFWRTAAAMGLEQWASSAVPDFSWVVFKLRDGLGLELSTQEDSPFIRYRFVALEDE